jgi:hypothetical protein
LPTHECELVGAILDPCSRRKTVHRERAIVGEPATLPYTVDGRRPVGVGPRSARLQQPRRDVAGRFVDDERLASGEALGDERRDVTVAAELA